MSSYPHYKCLVWITPFSQRFAVTSSQNDPSIVTTLTATSFRALRAQIGGNCPGSVFHSVSPNEQPDRRPALETHRNRTEFAGWHTECDILVMGEPES